MTLSHSPSIVKDGLVLYYDMGNVKKSFKGMPTTNVLTYPEANWTGSAFSLTYNYDATSTATMNYVTGVSNPINSQGILRYTTGTTGYKFWALRGNVPSSGTYTFSYYARISSGINNNLNNSQLWRNTDVDGSVTGDWNPTYTNEWKRYITTGTVTSYLDYFPIHSGSITGGYTIDYCGFQLEAGPIASPWLNGTRSNTQSLIDLTGNNTLTANSLTYASDNTFSFNGTSNYISASSILDSLWNSGSWTVNCWVNWPTVNRGSALDNSILGHGSNTNNNGLHLVERGGSILFGLYANDLTGLTTVPAGTWLNLSFVFNYTTKLKSIYINGVLDNSGGTVGYSGTGSNTVIGSSLGSRFMLGTLSNLSIYNRNLSAAEIKNNYVALKGRYGI